MKTVGLYARVSTSDGRQDTEVQLTALRKYCENKDLKWIEYVDEESGSTEDRKNYQRLMADCRAGKISRVVVFRFDRFARSVKTMVDGLDEFNRLGIDFVSLSENIQTDSPIGRAMYVIISAFSAMEKDILKQRVMAGLQKARESHIQLGRPRKGVDIGRAIELKRQGLGLRRIGRELGVSHATINRYLQAVTKTPSAKVA